MSDPAALAYADAVSNDTKEHMALIKKARDYHEGEQPVELTDRLREFLGLDTRSGDDSPFVLNVCAIVTDAVVERLKVIGFDSDEAGEVKPLAAWAWERWTQNRMDGVQNATHTAAVRDGCAYILVDGDDEARRARFTFLPEYTDAVEADGDGYGIRVFYANDDEAIAYAVKHWTETRYTETKTGIKREAVRRMDVFWPDRVGRYEYDKEWKQIDLRPWVDKLGKPLGVPVIPFQNIEGRCEATAAWPMQDLINKTLVDLAAAADISALGILVLLGIIPTTDGQPPREDGSNAVKFQPGSFIYTSKGPGDADVKRIPGEDVAPLAALIQQYIMWTAGVTSTPPARFQASTNVKAEGTLKQEEAPLLAKVAPKQTKFGDAWEDVLYMARKIENTFYGGMLPEDAFLATQWAPTATRDELAELQMLEAKKRLSVPREKLWAEMGYSQEEIQEMTAQADAEAAAAMERQQAIIGARPNGVMN